MKEKFIEKVKDVYDLKENSLVIVSTDRISAFDSVLTNVTIPYKGIVVNKMSQFWFSYTSTLIRNHMISASTSDMPKDFRKREFNGRCMLVNKLEMLPLQCIVRGYITGSGWESYKNSGSVCDIELPRGLQESEKLKYPIYTPIIKTQDAHNKQVSFEQTVDILGGDEKLAEELRNMSIRLYQTCSAFAEKKGILIADIKFEFGLDEYGNIILAEAITPDNSRLWDARTYKLGQLQRNFDKQYLKDWLKEENLANTPSEAVIPEKVIKETSKRYIEAYKILIK